MRSAAHELELFYRESTEEFASAILRLARAMLDGRLRPELARGSLERRIVETMTLAHLHGRRRVLIEVDAAAGGRAWSREDRDAASLARARFGDLIAQVPFTEAVGSLLEREPRLGASWQEIAELYQHGPAFAAVRSASLQVTEHVQRAVTVLLDQGAPVPTAERVVAEIGGWGRAYAETVYRTNVATAYMDGRREESLRPLVRARMPAWELFTAQDVDVRDNHEDGHGFIAATDDPIWGTLAPPLGFNCRCQVRLVSVEELEARGLLDAAGGVIRYLPPGFAGFGPDPGFRRAA